MRRPGSLSSVTPQSLSNSCAHRVVRDMAVAGQLVRERAHVAGALHIVLAAQRVHADAGPADIAGRHRQVGDRHHRGRALAVFGDAEPVIDRAIAAGGIKPRRARGWFAAGTPVSLATSSGLLRGCGDELGPVQEFVPVAALADECLVDQAFGDDRHAPAHSPSRHWCRGAAPDDRPPRYGRCAPDRCAADRSTISLAPCAQPLLHARGEDRMARRSDWRR